MSQSPPPPSQAPPAATDQDGDVPMDEFGSAINTFLTKSNLPVSEKKRLENAVIQKEQERKAKEMELEERFNKLQQEIAKEREETQKEKEEQKKLMGVFANLVAERQLVNATPEHKQQYTQALTQRPISEFNNLMQPVAASMSLHNQTQQQQDYHSRDQQMYQNNFAQRYNNTQQQYQSQQFRESYLSLQKPHASVDRRMNLQMTYQQQPIEASANNNNNTGYAKSETSAYGGWIAPAPRLAPLVAQIIVENHKLADHDADFNCKVPTHYPLPSGAKRLFA